MGSANPAMPLTSHSLAGCRIAQINGQHYHSLKAVELFPVVINVICLFSPSINNYLKVRKIAYTWFNNIENV